MNMNRTESSSLNKQRKLCEKIWNKRKSDYFKKLRYFCNNPGTKHRNGELIELEIFIDNLFQKVQKLDKRFQKLKYIYICLIKIK